MKFLDKEEGLKICSKRTGSYIELYPPPPKKGIVVLDSWCLEGPLCGGWGVCGGVHLQFDSLCWPEIPLGTHLIFLCNVLLVRIVSRVERISLLSRS